MRWPRSSDSSRRWPRPGSSQRDTSCASSRAVVQEPVQPALEVRQLVQHLRLQGFHGEKRNQPDHRPQPLHQSAAVGQVQHVVIELVLLVPQADARARDIRHGLGDAQEVLEELGGDVLVDVIVQRQLQGDAQHVEREHRHPAGGVGLVEPDALGQRRAAVEHADIVQAEEAALEDVPARHVLAVDPPGEVQQQLVKDALQENQVGLAAALAIDLVNAPRRPGVHRRIDVAEVPLVGRHLAVGVHVPFAQQQHQLLLGELRIDQREGQAMERRVPGSSTTDTPTCPASTGFRRC